MRRLLTLPYSNGITYENFLFIYYGDIYRSNFIISKSVTKHRHEYSHDIYQENHSEKKQ